MKSIALGLCLAFAAFAPVSALADGTTFVFQSVVSPGDPAFTQLLGINNAGTIAGYFGDGTVVPNNGFTLVLPSTYIPENFPGSAQTQVVGINDGGETVGFWIDGAGVQHGFTDIGGTFTSVNNPMTTTVTQLLGVNNAGTAAGPTAQEISIPSPGSPAHSHQYLSPAWLARKPRTSIMREWLSDLT